MCKQKKNANNNNANNDNSNTVICNITARGLVSRVNNEGTSFECLVGQPEVSGNRTAVSLSLNIYEHRRGKGKCSRSGLCYVFCMNADFVMYFALYFFCVKVSWFRAHQIFIHIPSSPMIIVCCFTKSFVTSPPKQNKRFKLSLRNLKKPTRLFFPTSHT